VFDQATLRGEFDAKQAMKLQARGAIRRSKSQAQTFGRTSRRRILRKASDSSPRLRTPRSSVSGVPPEYDAEGLSHSFRSFGVKPSDGDAQSGDGEQNEEIDAKSVEVQEDGPPEWLAAKYEFVPVHTFSDEAADLLESLLVRDPEQRIGSTAFPSEKALRVHPFFEGISWVRLGDCVSLCSLSGQLRSLLFAKLTGLGCVRCRRNSSEEPTIPHSFLQIASMQIRKNGSIEIETTQMPRTNGRMAGDHQAPPAVAACTRGRSVNWMIGTTCAKMPTNVRSFKGCWHWNQIPKTRAAGHAGTVMRSTLAAAVWCNRTPTQFAQQTTSGMHFVANPTSKQAKMNRNHSRNGTLGM